MIELLSNKTTYEAGDVVSHYVKQKNLLRQEETILNRFRERLPTMRMLDIGVGAGRTTYHFARSVREYVGIDYAANMIKACKEQFRHLPEAVSFHVCDATAMTMFDSASFDFVLFSFNGIDGVSHEDRLKILREVRRLCKPGASFCFSSHNVRSIPGLYKIGTPGTAKRLYRIFVRNPLLLLLNGPRAKLSKQNHVMIRDGVHWFRLKLYYITPEEQIRQLNENGFQNVEVIGVDGREITNPTNFHGLTDSWFYYVCNA